MLVARRNGVEVPVQWAAKERQPREARSDLIVTNLLETQLIWRAVNINTRNLGPSECKFFGYSGCNYDARVRRASIFA